MVSENQDVLVKVLVVVSFVFVSIFLFILSLPFVFGIVGALFFSSPNYRQESINKFNDVSSTWEEENVDEMYLISSLGVFHHTADVTGEFSSTCSSDVVYNEGALYGDNPPAEAYPQKCFSFLKNFGLSIFNENDPPFIFDYLNNQTGDAVSINTKKYVFELAEMEGKKSNLRSLYCDDVNGGFFEYNFWDDKCYVYKVLYKVCVLIDPTTKLFKKYSTGDVGYGCYTNGENSLYRYDKSLHNDKEISQFKVTVEIRSIYDPDVFYWRMTSSDTRYVKGFGDSFVNMIITGWVFMSLGIGMICFEVGIVLCIISCFFVIVCFCLGPKDGLLMIFFLCGGVCVIYLVNLIKGEKGSKEVRKIHIIDSGVQSEKVNKNFSSKDIDLTEQKITQIYENINKEYNETPILNKKDNKKECDDDFGGYIPVEPEIIYFPSTHSRINY